MFELIALCICVLNQIGEEKSYKQKIYLHDLLYVYMYLHLFWILYFFM